MSFSGYRATTQFHPERVIQPLRTATISRLHTAGFRIYRRARDLLQYSTGPSRKGMPPKVHRFRATKRKPAQPYSPLREGVFYSVQPDDWATIVGPSLMPGGRRGNLRKIEEEHPFMGPAFQAELPQLPALWAGSITN